MWIHLPSTSSPSVPASQDWSLDYEALSRDLERSATSNGKSRSARYWRRGLETGAWTTLLSGQTLRRLTRALGLDAYISSLAVCPVRPSRSPGNAGKRTTNGTSSQKSSELQPDWDTQASFWKTSEPPAAITTTPFDPNFERWVTRLKKLSSQRRKLAHHIGENGSSSWPTLRVSSANGPSEGEIEGGNPKRRLETEVVNWPTPAARDYKGFDPPGKRNTRQDPAMYLSSHLGQTMQRDGHTCSTSCRRLSPRFAEKLMGLPEMWVNSSERLEMASFQAWRQELGRCFQANRTSTLPRKEVCPECEGRNLNEDGTVCYDCQAADFRRE